MSEPWLARVAASETTPRRARVLLWLGAVAVACLAILGYDLAAEPHFADESAYYSQTYYARLYAEGRWNDVAWLDYPAYDLPPLPKYLIGGVIALTGRRWPGPAEASAWYGDIERRFEPPGALVAARRPFVLMGVLGCLAVFGLGRITGGNVAGTLAALLLAINPLYRMLARRAMSDVPCEALTLLALGIGLLAWSRWQRNEQPRRIWTLGLASGAVAGLALLCKMSAMLAFFVLGAWAVLGLVLASGRRLGTLAAGGLATAAAAAVTCLALNPYLTAQPPAPLPRGLRPVAALSLLDRTRKLVDLRVEVARGQQQLFPHNALPGWYDEVSTVLVQGFGRFGPFGPAHGDSTRRFDWEQDFGAPLWIGVVAIGVVWAVGAGRACRRRGEPPNAWALLLGYAVVLVVVTAYLPLAWDRYFLALQAPACLLAAGGLVALARRVAAGAGFVSPPSGK